MASAALRKKLNYCSTLSQNRINFTNKFSHRYSHEAQLTKLSQELGGHVLSCVVESVQHFVLRCLSTGRNRIISPSLLGTLQSQGHGPDRVISLWSIWGHELGIGHRM